MKPDKEYADLVTENVDPPKSSNVTIESKTSLVQTGKMKVKSTS